MCRWIFPILVALVGTSAGAQDICKWVDAAGAVHFFQLGAVDHPCDVRIRVVHPDPDELARAQQRYLRLRDQMLRPPDAKATADESAQTRAQRDTEIKRRCEDAKAELRFLQGAWGMRLVQPSAQPDEGPFDWLDDQERQMLTDAWRMQVNDWCGPSPPASSSPEPNRVYSVPPPPRASPTGR